MKISNKIKDALTRLGPDYQIVKIDGEVCLYRDLHNGFDIEVSGMNISGRKKYAGFVTVWQQHPLQTVECIDDVGTQQDLEKTLIKISEKYTD